MAVSNMIRRITEEDVKIDMTAMIDVTFQLLIFFMCTLQFKKIEGRIDCYLPKDVGVFSAPSKKNPEEPINIKLLKEAKETVIWIGDSKLKGENKFDTLYTKIDAIISRTPTAPVIIDPDIDIAFQDVISCLNACRKIQEKSYGKEMQIKFAAKALAEIK